MRYPRRRGGRIRVCHHTVRRRLSGIALLAACADRAPTADPPVVVAESAGLWEVGEPEACAAPVTPHWTDRSDLVGGGLAWHANGYTDTACVAFEKRDSGWRVWSSGVKNELYRHDLETGESTVFAVPDLDLRLVVDDLDGDGQDDVGAFLIGGTMIWGGESEPTPLPPDAQVAYTYAPLDLDGDGLDDLVILGLGADGEVPPAPQVLRNAGGRTFAAAVSAPTGGVGMGFSSQVLDWDGDDDPDILQCSDFGSVNGGNGILVDEDGTLAVGDARGADIVANCMSTSFGDVDGDGTLDIYVAQNGPQRLLLDEGAYGFVDAGKALIDAAYTDGQMGWSGVTVDADNDGRADIVLATSDFERNERGIWPVWWLRQQDDGTFVESGADAGMPQSTSARGLALRDVNGDGVVDALVGDIERLPYLLLSDGCSEGGWVEVAAPAGSVVTVEAGGRIWAALVSRQDGWCGWGPPIAHIGLGDVERIDRITVKAPWQARAWIEGVPARTRLTWTPDGGDSG